MAATMRTTAGEGRGKGRRWDWFDGIYTGETGRDSLTDKVDIS